jgi:hypothetical protein
MNKVFFVYNEMVPTICFKEIELINPPRTNPAKKK